MNSLRKGWFTEKVHDLWAGQCLSLKVEQVLHEETSDYQKIEVFQTRCHGRALVLDDIIQTTDHDEFAYQEMITHVPVNSHPDPQHVLVIGGGDGGVARELDKNPAVTKVTMCEIDGKVIEASKKFLPNLSVGFSSPKLTLHVGDGFAFMKQHKAEFDVIITDSSDPVGPSECLFEKSYFELMKEALKPGGIICSQAQSPWHNLEMICNQVTFCRDLFPVVNYCTCTVPTYSGVIGLLLCGTDMDTNFLEPVREFSDQELDELPLRYYNRDVHRAAFVLPQFVSKALKRKTST